MSLYTVEQIELIRRLRSSGISAQQIIEAFQTFDRLDHELPRTSDSQISIFPTTPNMIFPPHMRYPPQPSTLGAAFFEPDEIKSMSFPNGALSMPRLPSAYHPHHHPNLYHHLKNGGSPSVSMAPPVTSVPTPVVVNASDPHSLMDCLDDTTEYPADLQQPEQPPIPKKIISIANNNMPHISSTSKQQSVQSPINSIATPVSSTPLSAEHCSGASLSSYRHYVSLDQIEPDIANHVMELMNREDQAIAEVREYVASNQLRQQAIAHKCGISQPYVSKFLNGSYRELSERVRKIIFHWYAKTKKEHMHAIENGAADSVHMKRERFIFKPVHVRLLEKYFHAEPYPNLPRREEMVRALNHAYQAHKGAVSLNEKEVVTEQVVTTWFSNKRKEKKRKDVKFRQMRCTPNGGGHKLLLNQYLDNLRQTAIAKNEHRLSSDDVEIDGEIDKNDGGEYFERKPFDDVPPNLVDSNQDENVLEYQLNAVNSSVYALLNPYEENQAAPHILDNGRHNGSNHGGLEVEEATA